MNQSFSSFYNPNLPCILLVGEESPESLTIEEFIGGADNVYPRTVEQVYQEIAEAFDAQGYYEFDVGFYALPCTLYPLQDNHNPNPPTETNMTQPPYTAKQYQSNIDIIERFQNNLRNELHDLLKRQKEYNSTMLIKTSNRVQKWTAWVSKDFRNQINKVVETLESNERFKRAFIAKRDEILALKS